MSRDVLSLHKAARLRRGRDCCWRTCPMLARRAARRTGRCKTPPPDVLPRSDPALATGACDMCGICGEIRFDSNAVDVAAVSRMMQALAPRGPDGSGLFAHERVALGHRRLRIIDL